LRTRLGGSLVAGQLAAGPDRILDPIPYGLRLFRVNLAARARQAASFHGLLNGAVTHTVAAGEFT